MLFGSFNPRARDGREKRFTVILNRCPRFNPRARDGREMAKMIDDEAANVSIHAPVMDANYLYIRLKC